MGEKRPHRASGGGTTSRNRKILELGSNCAAALLSVLCMALAVFRYRLEAETEGTCMLHA
eukprot:431998-Alexandrium_andersonii.AAC.1